MTYQFLLLLLVTFVGITTSQLNSKCLTPNKEEATCLALTECSVLYELLLIKNRSREQTQFLLQSQCGSVDKKILVCCGSSDNFQSVPVVTRTGTVGTVLSEDVLPARTRCGRQVAGSRILGGEAAGLEEFPWMALLEYQRNNRSRGHSCGGVLISPRYVLTAAHCVVGVVVRRIGQVYRVRLGEYDTSKESDCTPDSGCADPPMDIEVEERIAHAEYNESDRSRPNDIALLRLASEAPYTTFIRPICLPTPTDVSKPGERLFVAGWGKVNPDNNTYSTVKLKVDVPVVAQTECKEKFVQKGASISAKQICAGGEAGKDSCQGDSGGPLMHTVPGNSNLWYLEGIVSFGVKCGSESWPGVYSRVIEYVDWIKSNVRK